MRLSLIKPDGSMMYYPKIRGIAQSEDGSLILLHQDDSERHIPADEWVRVEVEKPIFKAKIGA